MSWAGNVTGKGMRIGVCEFLVGKCRRKRQFGGARCKWNFNIKRALWKFLEGVDCIDMYA